MAARLTQASQSLPQARLDSSHFSQFSQQTRSNTLRNSNSAYYQTPKKSVKPPSITSLSIKQHRKPQVSFASSRERGRASRYDGRWVEEEVWSDEDGSTLGDDDDDLMRLLEVGHHEERGVGLQVERSYRLKVRRCISRFTTGSLASAPVFDFTAFSRVTERSENRSFGLTKSFSVDSVNALRATLAKYETSAIKHQAYLQDDRVKLVQLFANLRKLEDGVGALRTINAKAVANKLSTKHELDQIELAGQAELSRLAKLWEEAQPQYVTALQAAAGPPPRSSSIGKGGNGENGIEAMLISLMGGDPRELDRSEQAPSTTRGRRRLV
ncbi:hypothetical protein JCM5353_003284 [Sporobolomyces roseus]